MGAEGDLDQKVNHQPQHQVLFFLVVILWNLKESPPSRIKIVVDLDCLYRWFIVLVSKSMPSSLNDMLETTLDDLKFAHLHCCEDCCLMKVNTISLQTLFADHLSYQFYILCYVKTGV